MDYKEKYEQVLERARKLYHEPEFLDYGKEVIEEIFPELKKESEDERMREMAIKALYAPEAQSCIKSWGVNPDDVIAWLEKQDEQNLIMAKSPQLDEQKPAWSEDDEKNFQMLQKIICYSDTTTNLANKLSDWLTSLKKRIKS